MSNYGNAMLAYNVFKNELENDIDFARFKVNSYKTCYIEELKRVKAHLDGNEKILVLCKKERNIDYGVPKLLSKFNRKLNKLLFKEWN